MRVIVLRFCPPYFPITYFWAIVGSHPKAVSSGSTETRVVSRKDGWSDESCTVAHRGLASLPRRLRLALSRMSALACLALPRQGGCGRRRQGGRRTEAAVLAK